MTSGIHDGCSEGGARGVGHETRSSEGSPSPRTVGFDPDAHGAPRDSMATATAAQSQPRAHQPRRQHPSDYEDVAVKEEVEDSYEVAVASVFSSTQVHD